MVRVGKTFQARAVAHHVLRILLYPLQMQGVGKENTGILVLGATYTPWQIGSALCRRFGNACTPASLQIDAHAEHR